MISFYSDSQILNWYRKTGITSPVTVLKRVTNDMRLRYRIDAKGKMHCEGVAK